MKTMMMIISTPAITDRMDCYMFMHCVAAGLAGKSNEDAMRVDEVYCLAAGLLEAMGKVAFEADAAKKVIEINMERLPLVVVAW